MDEEVFRSMYLQLRESLELEVFIFDNVDSRKDFFEGKK